MSSIKKDILNYGILLLFFLTPLMYFGSRIYPHITSKTFFFYGFANILFFYWLYIILIDKSYRLSRKQWLFFAPLFLYVIWMTIAGIFAVNPHLALWSSLGRGTGLLTLYYSTTTAIIVASIVKNNGIRYIYSILKWFIISSSLVVLTVWLGNEGFHLQGGLFVNSGGGGIIGNSSLAAAYLIFSLFFGLFLIFSNSIQKKIKIFTGVILAFILFSPLFINLFGLLQRGELLGSARGAMIGIIVGVGIMIVSYFSFSNNKALKIIGIIGIFLSLLIFSIGWSKFMNPDTAIHQKFTEVASGTRFLFWNVAQESMNKHPWLGYGPENYMIAFQENFNPQILNKDLSVEAWNDRAHNIYFDTGVSGGYPAIIFYSIFLLSIFYGIFVLFKNNKISNVQVGIFYGLLCAYIFQNLFVFDSTLSIMNLFMFAGLAFGYIGYKSDDEKKNKEEQNGKQKKIIVSQTNEMLIGTTLLVLCVIFWIYFSILPADKSKAFWSVFSKKIEVRSDYSNLLQGSSVGNDWDVSGLAHDVYKSYALNPIQIKNNKAMLPIYEKDLNSLLKYLESVSRENTTDFRLYKKIFDLYSTSIFLGDKRNDPILIQHLFEVLNQAKELSPNNPEVYWGMAQLYAWSGDFKNIEQVYKQAIDLDPSVSASHKLLIQFAQAIRDQKLYNEAIIQAEKDIPGFVEANKKELNIITK
ncbi:MAG: hypothetical protein UR85_C0005G0028 [Candidatus Nomurabacteria bacterium GW2011_GWF2_35_66]|uniref:O-antigen ligase-related domain-containing protein n=1 Tax=Candidatus Nomurabacteria bacterium GW2011_GWE1_35_16 TaxID=1618761 RepID=A0A0G0BAU8_9BACT|nr:MAG: hypothetical protein UR55_C0006G0029 [Candidatus Nomurabacteria bacterium GW2011_GWF1_34_20]KKP63257.1 MAG: hypothetical protein UR57_C0007G0029 [Candidatus Nomurabacteria bacterium GW2011_GWE2_34_25]KKP66459.1 MAG: hypothetical protein UR64_C0007G0028 [Candidatus Nomurabacteria bacterium GW2011_GWE1_35_16]KKP83353.1 MAG: hypothetical protein UR85_C0005G0028 [Candidatus Nomurabacteria bacterium GW2011_GWF2_35_66]HAE36464.1 hypothetical protein [Candidatus Nomurabacteria bacterium]